MMQSAAPLGEPQSPQLGWPVAGSSSELLPERRRSSGRFASFDITTGDDMLRARRAIEIAVTHVFGVDSASMAMTTRGANRVANARQVAMYLAHVACGLSLTDVGLMFRRDRTTVAHGCLKVEMRRDDVQFDRALDVLGWAMPTVVLRPDGAVFGN